MMMRMANLLRDGMLMTPMMWAVKMLTYRYVRVVHDDGVDGDEDGLDGEPDGLVGDPDGLVGLVGDEDGLEGEDGLDGDDDGLVGEDGLDGEDDGFVGDPEGSDVKCNV